MNNSTLSYFKLKDLFGNHLNKFYHFIDSGLGPLEKLLTENHCYDSINFSHIGPEFEDNLNTIVNLSGEKKHALKNLSTFYAHHYLSLNAEFLQHLLAIQTGPHPTELYIRFLRKLRNDYLIINKATLNVILEQLSKGKKLPEYAIINTGNICDQEDLDLWIAVREEEDKQLLNPYITSLSQQCWKRTIKLHFYLAEVLKSPYYSGTMEEYDHLLNGAPKNIVIISQILDSAFFAGSSSLFSDLNNKLMGKYLNGDQHSNYYYQGLVFGALREIESLLHQEPPIFQINPKKEIYRIIRIIISVMRAKFNIETSDTFEIIDILIKKDPKNRKNYISLLEIYTFVEVLRYLYSLMVIQENRIPLDDHFILRHLEKILKIMGLTQQEYFLTRHNFLDIYVHYLDKSKEISREFQQELKEHVNDISILQKEIHVLAEIPQRKKNNQPLPVLIMNLMSTYEGNAHWDEFLEFFEKEPEIIDTFLAEMDNCQQDADQIIDDYIQMMIKDAPILVDFLMLLGQAGRRRKDFNMVNRFINATVTQLMSNKQARENFANLFYYYTIDIHKFIKSLNFRNVIKFMDIFSVFGQDEQLYFAITKKLTSLLNIYNVSSNYIKRYFANVLDNYPRFTAYADDFQEMNRITKMILQESYQIKDTKLCEQKLRDYFNIELCRLSLMMLNLEDHQQICREFRQMVDRFIREMYLNTWHQLSREMPESFGNLKPFNGIGIFASGGNAREEAFDNDYDMFVLVMPEVYQSQSNLAHFAFNKLTARLASALSRSGISPHNRFIEHCGSYIITIEEMEKFFQQTGPTDFIDKTEILNSRLVIGDARLEGQLYKKIISPFIFKDYSNFIFCLQNEMKSRHQHCKESDAGLDLKEDIGGLRDIHLFLSILKAFFGIRTPITWKVFQMLRNKMPTHFRQLKDIEKSLFFIKKVRDIYRLTVANDDLIDQDYLEKTAVFMGYSGRPSKKGDMLLNDLTRAKGRAIRNINNILDYYQAQLDKKG